MSEKSLRKSKSEATSSSPCSSSCRKRRFTTEIQVAAKTKSKSRPLKRRKVVPEPPSSLPESSPKQEPRSVDYRNVLETLKQSAKQAHLAAYPKLLTLAKKLGFNKEAVMSALTYVRESAPLVIHIYTSFLDEFTKSERYLNGYEVKRYSVTNQGCGRFQAESRIFQKLYDYAVPEDRVKYGALNVTGDPKGCTAAHGYGNAFLVLKPHMRSRVTITPGDSFCTFLKPLATLDCFAHLLTDTNYYNTDDLKEFLTVPNASPPNTTTTTTTANRQIYREIQIHGPILFKEDISALVTPANPDPFTLSLAQKFADTHKIALLFY